MEARKPPPFCNGDGHALILDPVQHRIGHKIAHGTFDLAAVVAVAVDFGGGLGHDTRLQLFDRAGQFLDPRLDRGILASPRHPADRVAARIDQVARIIEGQFRWPRYLE
jgi:hypothetical protein